MLILLLVKEISDHLKSLRFILTFVMATVLFIVSAALFIPDFRQQMSDYDQGRNELMTDLSNRANQRAGLFFVYSFNYNGPWVTKRPNHLSFISEGHDRNLPNAFQPSAFRVYGPAKQVRSNILLWRSEVVDWALIVGIILSFAALVLAYDGVSGERENGTLRLGLSNAVSRFTVLFSKFLGALICLAAALTVGIVMNLIIVTGVGGIPLTAPDWIVVGLSFLLALLYISVFLMLGLFVSSITREAATSLVVGLLCWALFVIVIPRSGGFIATRISDLPTWSKAQLDAYSKEREARKEYEKDNPEIARAGMSGHWSPGEPLERAFVMSDGWSVAFDGYRNGMIHQVELARKATLISPYTSFTMGLEILTESGITHYKEFFRQVQDYRLTMRQQLVDLYPLPMKWHDSDEKLRTEDTMAKFQKAIEPIDFDSISKFEEKRAGLPVLINEALPYFLLLVLFNVLFFAGAFVSFLRYDVR